MNEIADTPIGRLGRFCDGVMEIAGDEYRTSGLMFADTSEVVKTALAQAKEIDRLKAGIGKAINQAQRGQPAGPALLNAWRTLAGMPPCNMRDWSEQDMAAYRAVMDDVEGKLKQSIRDRQIHVRALEAENAALRAELAETPPTLEWLKQKLGDDPDAAKGMHAWKNGFVWLDGPQCCYLDRDHLCTRAAVEAAISAGAA